MMGDWWGPITSKLDLVPKYLTSLLRSRRRREEFDSVRTFCFFLGYPRSGHSVVGQLVNAHPNAVVSHELNVLRYLKPGFSSEQIYTLILERDRWFSDRGRQWTGYDYEIPGTWQGDYETLRVIGDKNGGATSNWLAQDPAKLDLLEDRTDATLRAVHVIRNPYDNISTMVREGSTTLEQAVDGYFRLARSAAQVRDRLDDEAFLDVHHETLLEDTKETLAEICRFLGLATDEDHLQACAEFVYDEPNQSRWERDWPEDVVEEVRERADRYEFLESYRFDG